jgi:chitin disaccharide deacetylase
MVYDAVTNPGGPGNRTVLLIADDLGLNSGINEAVLRAHHEGGLHAASLMLGQPASAAAVVMARESASLQVGWHVHVCDSQPLTCPAWPWGRSAFRAGLALTGWPAARRLVREELRGQWAAFCATGLPCRFINGHHHLHVHPVVLSELERLLPPGPRPWLRGFAIRRFAPRRGSGGRIEHWVSPWVSRRLRRRGGWRLSDSLWGLDRLGAMDSREVRAVVPGLPGGLHEFLFHPRTADPGADADFAALLGLVGLRSARGELD